jgi:hypothetical protein
MNATATFFVSAGRCGTQWLANMLSRFYGDLADSRHEPIDHKYCPRVLMRSSLGLEGHPHRGDVLEHLAQIHEILSTREYIETGWPAFAAIPLLRQEYGPRLRVVHITRHPVYSACSMVTHRYYQPELRDDGYTRYAILHPTDEGVLHKEYAASWDAMSAYERCLVHWMEINAYGLEARAASESEVDWFQVRMEDLIDPQTGRLAELIDFLRLPQRSEIIEATRIRFDQFRTTTHIAIGWEQIRKHSAVTDLAASLGYDAEVASAKEIMDRYWRAPAHGDGCQTLPTPSY